MSNLTLAIDEDLLRRARVKAANAGTSVNAVVREAIESYAGEDEDERLWQEFLDSAAASTYSSHGWKWNRDELYEERMNRDAHEGSQRRRGHLRG